jgi:hypothetical protein
MIHRIDFLASRKSDRIFCIKNQSKDIQILAFESKIVLAYLSLLK